jgi:hypothetical protein
MIVYLPPKSICRVCGKFKRVDLRRICRDCYREELFRDTVLLFLLGVLFTVVGAALGLALFKLFGRW